MRIAVPYENEEVFQHFGHTQQFKFYNLMNGMIVSTMIMDTDGSGHGKLAAFLNSNKVDVLICGGIGQGARTALQQAGISLFPGVNGKADDVVLAYLKGNLIFNPLFTCDHHDHHGEEDCKDHDCHCH